MIVNSSGRLDARIALIGEAPGAEEEAKGLPFIGTSGQFLDRMLADAGIARGECFVSNVCRFRPENNDIERFVVRATKTGRLPKNVKGDGWIFYNNCWVQPFVPAHVEKLKEELIRCRPNVVVPLGNIALWALTGQFGIMNWSGTVMPSTLIPGMKVIPNIHPAAVLRQYELRNISVQYYRTVAREALFNNIRESNWLLHIQPNLTSAIDFLQHLRDRALGNPDVLPSVDIETRSRQIACIGFGLSRLEAMCIPLMSVDKPLGYWSEDEEFAITLEIIKTLRVLKFFGQNFLYDAQYIARQMALRSLPIHDCMTAQHVMFPGTPKGLDDLVKLYAAQPRFWKNESKEWEKGLGEQQLWTYNCKDCVFTVEVGEAQIPAIDALGKRSQFENEMAMFEPKLTTMLRGVRMDMETRASMSKELKIALDARQQRLSKLFGHPVNPRSPLQLKKLFYDDLKIKPVMKLGKKGEPAKVSVNEEALQTIATREPLLLPVIESIGQCRTIGIFKSTFVGAKLEQQRLRCYYGSAETFRLTSREDAFGSGTNLQNIPLWDEKDEAKKREEDKLPNIRKLFIPDEGYFIWEQDLERADLQVVAWEANDELLKQRLREGVDQHTENAKDLNCNRQAAKIWVHGTNYGGKSATMARNTGVTAHQSDRMHRRYFEIHPGIKDWHRRIESELLSRRFVTNRFGYWRYYFGRVEQLLSEALAWIPQSTVAIVTNKAWLAIYHQIPEAQILLQVHDSLVGQLPIGMEATLPLILKLSEIVVPYPDPLIISWSIKVSNYSWGACKSLVA